MELMWRNIGYMFEKINDYDLLGKNKSTEKSSNRVISYEYSQQTNISKF